MSSIDSGDKLSSSARPPLMVFSAGEKTPSAGERSSDLPGAVSTYVQLGSEQEVALITGSEDNQPISLGANQEIRPDDQGCGGNDIPDCQADLDISRQSSSTEGSLGVRLGKRTLENLAFSIEQSREEFVRPNDILKKIAEWTESQQYKLRKVCRKGLAAIRLNEATFAFLEEGHGLTIDKNNKLNPKGDAIKLIDLKDFVIDSEASSSRVEDSSSILKISELQDCEFIDVMGASFGMTGYQADRRPVDKRSKTNRLLDDMVRAEKERMASEGLELTDVRAVRRLAIVEKTKLAEILMVAISECMAVIDKRLLLFASASGAVRTARPINCILLSFKCEGLMPRRTKVGDKMVKRVSIDQEDYLCRMNISVASLYSGPANSNMDVIVEMEVNLKQTRILSLYSSCRNSVGSITASMEEIMNVQDEAFEIIIEHDLMDSMDREDDYEVLNFSELMGIMVLAGLRPHGLGSDAMNLMWSRSFYAVLKNVAEFKTLFKDGRAKKHLVDSLSLFYLVEPLIADEEDRKTMLVNIMLWAIFDESRDTMQLTSRTSRWQSSLHIAGQILWIISCLYDYTKLTEVNYKFLPLILIHNYSVTGKWAISGYNMSQWLASVTNISSDRLANDDAIVHYLDRTGLPLTVDEANLLSQGEEIISKVNVLIKSLEKATAGLEIASRLTRRSRKEAAAIFYHLICMVMKGTPYYMFGEEELNSSEVNSTLAKELKVKVDGGLINPDDYTNIIVELLQEADSGFSLMLDEIPAKEDIQSIFLTLSQQVFATQNDSGKLPDEETMGIVVSEGVHQYQIQQDVIRKRIAELATATSITGQRQDDSLQVGGLMSKLAQTYGTVINQGICLIGGKVLSAKVGYSKDASSETMGMSVRLGETQLFGASTKVAEDYKASSLRDLTVTQRLVVLEGFSIDTNCRFIFDFEKFKNALKDIVSTESAIGYDVRSALRQSKVRSSRTPRISNIIEAEGVVPFIFDDDNQVDRQEEPESSSTAERRKPSRWQLLIADLDKVIRDDALLASKYYVFRELNFPIFIVAMPIDVATSLLLILAAALDVAWNASTWVHDLAVDLQSRSSFDNVKWADNYGIRAVSNVVFGTAVFASSAWLFTARTAISGTISFMVVTIDGLKEMIKQAYSSALLPIRAKMIDWAVRIELRTGLEVLSKDEHYSANLVDNLANCRQEAGFFRKQVTRMTSFILSSLIFPVRLVPSIISKVCRGLKKTYQYIIEKLKNVRKGVASKLANASRRMAEVASKNDSMRLSISKNEQNLGVKARTELGSIETPEINIIDLEEDLEEQRCLDAVRREVMKVVLVGALSRGKTNEPTEEEEMIKDGLEPIEGRQADEVDAPKRDNEGGSGDRMYQDEEDDARVRSGKEASTSNQDGGIMTTESCGLELDDRVMNLLRRRRHRRVNLDEGCNEANKENTSQLENCGLKSAAVNYLSNKIAVFGYKKALEAIKRTEEDDEPAMRQVPDETESSAVEGLKSADLDILSCHYLQETLGTSADYLMADSEDCEGELGLSLVGEVYILHKKYKQGAALQGSGKLTMIKLNSLNCFFLYEKMLMNEGLEVIRFSLHDSSSIYRGEYNAREYISTGYNDNHKVIIGRVSLLMNSKVGEEMIVSASHMVPYGRFCREAESYDGVDVLCSNWVFSEGPLDVGPEMNPLQEFLGTKKFLGAIKSDFFIGDVDSDFLMFVCNRGDYRGHSGGLILDRKNRPIAICVKQLKINNQLAIDDNKSIIIGCKLSELNSKIVVFNSKKIINCNECNLENEAIDIKESTVGVTVSMGRLKIDDCVVSGEDSPAPIRNQMSVIQTGLLEKFCEINKMRGSGMFLETQTRGNVLMRLFEILTVNKETRMFDEPSEWLIRTIFNSMLGNKISMFVICSNMLNLAICSLFTCIGIQFKRAKNYFSLECICKNNNNNRKSEIIIISSDDLLVDMAKTKSVHRNSFKDRCKVYVLSRTCKADNNVDKVIIRSMLLVSTEVSVKAWELRPTINLEASHKMMEAPVMRYSQNSGQFKILTIKGGYNKSNPEESKSSVSGRTTILTLATTKSAQENLVAWIVSDKDLFKNDMTVLNFASLSSEAVFNSLIRSETLCLASWSSGDLTTKVFYNVVMDVLSDHLEISMIEQSLNYRMATLGEESNRIYLSGSLESEHLLLDSGSYKLMEIKMSDTSNPKINFIDYFEGVLDRATIRGRTIFRKLTEQNTDKMMELDSVLSTSSFSIERKKLLTEDFIRMDQARIKSILEKLRDLMEGLKACREEIKIKITYKIRAFIMQIKFKANKAARLFKRNLMMLKSKAISLTTIGCSLAREDDEDSFHSVGENDSDAGSSINEAAKTVRLADLDEELINVGSSSESDDEEAGAEKNPITIPDFKESRKSVLFKISAKAKQMAIVIKNFWANLAAWCSDKVGLIKDKTALMILKIKNKLGGLIPRWRSENNGKAGVERCGYQNYDEDDKPVIKKIFKSSAVSATLLKFFPCDSTTEVGGRLLAQFCADNVIYEIINCLNRTMGNVYWKLTAVPSSIIAAAELCCQLTNKTATINCFGVELRMGGPPFNGFVPSMIELVNYIVNAIKQNTTVSVNCVIPTGLVLSERLTDGKATSLSMLMEASFKVFELAKRALFRVRLSGVITKLWKIITGRTSDVKLATGVLKAVPCYIETETVCYYGGAALLVTGLLKLAAIKTEEKLAMLGVIAEKKHLADNINLYINDRSEYANMIRATCVSSALLFCGETKGLKKTGSIIAAILALVDWFFSDETYGGLGLSAAHVISRAIAANSTLASFVAGLAAWWEDGSSGKICMNTLILLGRAKELKRKEGHVMKEEFLFEPSLLMKEQIREKEGNNALINKNVEAATALDECMRIIRKKNISARFMEKLTNDDKVNIRDEELLINIDAILDGRKYSEIFDNVLKIRDIYSNQCRYLGRLRELPMPREAVVESESKQVSVLMVASAMWQGVVDERSMRDWEAAGDSRSHVMIAIAERNDSPIYLNVSLEDMRSFSAEMVNIMSIIGEELRGLVIYVNTHRINWLNVINISNEKSTPGILTRNRTKCKLTASYLPFYKNRVEAMREILLNNDVDEENEIINVFAKRRIEKKKTSELTGKAAVITRTIQANECDYKTAICDVFNVVDKLIKVTRSKTGISVGMNFFVEFVGDDEICSSRANDEAERKGMVAKRISLDHSSYDGSQRNWSIEAMKKFRQAIVDEFFFERLRKRARFFFETCYESLKCRVMMTAQGDLFGITGQQMSGHATTSIDNSIKAKAYCVSIADKIERATGWVVLTETIRVQGDDTKMEVLCPKERAGLEDLVKEVISEEMGLMGQTVKKQKIEIFKANEASNFLSHYAYDCICVLRSGEGKKLAVLKMPGRNYFDNVNSLATTLKASKTKKYKKELGLLAAKSASFLTMYIGDPYLSSVCCMVLAYCLDEIKAMRRQTKKIVVSKDKLAYLLASSDDIETVSIQAANILELHGIGKIKDSYLFESWVIGSDDNERQKAISVLYLAQNLTKMMGRKGDAVLKNLIKEIKSIMLDVIAGKVTELSVDTLNRLVESGEEPLKLEIENVEVAYEPYLAFKNDIRFLAGVNKGKKRARFIIIKDWKEDKLDNKLMSMVIMDKKEQKECKKSNDVSIINDAGFNIVSKGAGIRVIETDEESVHLCRSNTEALLFGASISNTMNLILTKQTIMEKTLGTGSIIMRKWKLYDINELSCLEFISLFNNSEQDRYNLRIRADEVRERRKRIVTVFRDQMCCEFVNYFWRK